MEGEVLLAVILQVSAKTGVHLLNHEHRQTRSSRHIHPQELDYTVVMQLRPHQALCLEIADEFVRSSGQLVFEHDLMQMLVGASAQLHISKL